MYIGTKDTDSTSISNSHHHPLQDDNSPSNPDNPNNPNHNHNDEMRECLKEHFNQDHQESSSRGDRNNNGNGQDVGSENNSWNWGLREHSKTSLNFSEGILYIYIYIYIYIFIYISLTNIPNNLHNIIRIICFFTDFLMI